ncbi:MAG: HD domain-containing phosphohydrolase [Planctomycetota bacterium]
MDPNLVSSLLKQIEASDRSTAAHTWRVVLYTRALAEAFGVDDDTLRRLTHAAALHDVGKIDIPNAILQKPGKLTDDEFEIMKLHTVTGFARLAHIGVQDEIVLNLVKFHHEQWGGRGYPYGLEGEHIPPGARYFAVIDTFDALTSHRPYRHDVGPEAAKRAIDELERGKGTRYWPDAVDAFIGLHGSGAIDWIGLHFNDGSNTPEFDAGGVDRLKPV